MHPNAARVAEAASAAGLTIEDTLLPQAYGVFLVDGRPTMALVAGDNRLDEDRLLAAVGGSTVGRADADAVRAATGYPIGGVPPFGHPEPLPTVVDEDLLRFEAVWAAAGTPRHVFSLTAADLVRLSGGTVAPLATP